MKEYNGMPADRVGIVQWRKSARSGMGNCVEFARLASGAIAVRNSRYPDGPALVYPSDDFASFMAAAKRGELDELLR